MKTYEVELRRVSYVIVTVEAEDKDDAEDKAWAVCDERADNEATWDVASIEEMK
jgi:hypothetical protein